MSTDTKATHTPGPWELIPQHGGEQLIASRIDPVRLRLIGVAYSKAISAAEDAANARLIVSAPELLAACRKAQRYFDDQGPVLGESDASHAERMTREAIQDAIAKATS